MKLKIVRVRNYLEQECESPLTFLLGVKLEWKLNFNYCYYYYFYYYYDYYFISSSLKP